MRYGCMPMYQISVVNEEFTVENEEEHRDADAAVEEAIKGALAVGLRAGAQWNAVLRCGGDGWRGQRQPAFHGRGRSHSDPVIKMMNAYDRAAPIRLFLVCNAS